MTGFIVCTSLLVAWVVVYILYNRSLKKKRARREPVATLSTNARIVVAIAGGVFVAAGVASFIGR